MALFKMKWLRRLVRRNTNEIPLDQAERWKKRLSIMYALLAWQAFGIVGYMIYTGRTDWARHHGISSEEENLLSPAQQFARQLKLDNAKVFRISGLSLKEVEDPSSKSSTSEEESSPYC